MHLLYIFEKQKKQYFIGSFTMKHKHEDNQCYEYVFVLKLLNSKIKIVIINYTSTRMKRHIVVLRRHVIRLIVKINEIILMIH